MAIVVTADALRRLFPHASEGAIDAFVKRRDVLDRHGVTHTRSRLSYFLAQIGHESGGLTVWAENLNYSAKRMTEVWPSRFPTLESAQPYAGSPRALANKVYNGRMGNRVGTDDGWDYRGRGPIQITGRDGYAQVGAIAEIDLVSTPDVAALPVYGPAIAGAFWSWKGLNAAADVGDFRRATRLINGGTIGLADRERWLKRVADEVESLPGAPPTKAPPRDVVDEATRRERAAAKAGAGGVAAGAGGEVINSTTETPDKPMPAWVAPLGIALGMATVIVAAVLIARKQKRIAALWR